MGQQSERPERVELLDSQRPGVLPEAHVGQVERPDPVRGIRDLGERSQPLPGRLPVLETGVSNPGERQRQDKQGQQGRQQPQRPPQVESLEVDGAGLVTLRQQRLVIGNPLRTKKMSTPRKPPRKLATWA
jgi:hypothetical protein